MLLRLAKIARASVIVSVLGLLPGFTLAQTTDRLVGSWNFKVTVTGGCTTNCKYIGMIAFNQGGTVVEQRGTVVEYNGLGYIERRSSILASRCALCSSGRDPYVSTWIPYI